MTRYDRITEGRSEKELLRKLRGGDLTPDNLEVHSLPFFVKIQIQTSSLCNGMCTTCPYPETRSILPQGEMAEELFNEVVDQIKGRGVERTSLFLMNEPLLDPRLDRFTTHLKSMDPDTWALVFTNGLLLTGDRTLSLAHAGMDEINVSINGFDRASHNRVTKGIDFDQVMRNLADVGRLLQGGQLGGMRIKVVGLSFPGMEEGAKEFRDRTGLPVYLKPVTNRAGLIDTEKAGGSVSKSDTMTACQRPFVKAYVLFNGDMVLCNCDWMRTTVIGNIRSTPLEELWNSRAMMDVRRAHIRGVLPKNLPCGSCDYPYLI